jgi:hypothetical protein
MYRISLAIILMLWFLTSCDLFTLEEGIIYPSTYHHLELDQVLSLNEEFRNLNDDQICSTLNEFGFTGFSELLFENGVNPCADREIVLIAMNEPDTLDLYVQSVLLQNGKFTGVKDENSLSLLSIEPYRVLPINEGPGVGSEVVEWRLVYGNQIEESVEIPSTEIEVIVDALGVNRIWGHHYPELYIPLMPNVDPDKAQGIVNDLQNLQAKLPFCSSPDEIQITNSKKVIQNKNDDLVEIRIGWAAIGSVDTGIESDCSFIVDFMDGSIIVEEPDTFYQPVL